MKISHSLKKNQRYNKQYRGVQLNYNQPYYWWDKNIKQRTLTPNWELGGISNTFGRCRSVKAFRRRIYEWSQYLPNGIEFILIGKYVGQNVIGKTN